MKKIGMGIVIVAGLLLAGCTTTQEGATAGGLGGATIGGIIGHQSGRTTQGALIGGAIGAIGGAVVGNKMEQKMFCPTCGRVFSAGTKYCPFDGTKLKPQQK